MHGLPGTIVFYKQKLQNSEPIDLSQFVMDLREGDLKNPDTNPSIHNCNRSSHHQ